MNIKRSTLDEHRSVLCSLWLGAGRSSMNTDSGWRHIDVQMRHTRRLWKFVTDIKMQNMHPGPKHLFFFPLLFFSIQYPGTHYRAVPMLQIIL
jgi:hypothetical protein